MIQTLANSALNPAHQQRLTPYQQKQETISLLRTTLGYLPLPIDQLLPAESTLKAIAYKSKKLGLAYREEYKTLSARIVDIELFRRIGGAQ